MKRLVYLDVDGNEHCRKEWDVHHVFPKHLAKGHGEKAWIDLYKLPMFKPYHNLGKESLHANVELCPMPTKEMQYRMRMNLYADDSESPYDKFLHMNELVHYIGETSLDTRTVWVAERIADNLERQAPYILNGMVQVVEL